MASISACDHGVLWNLAGSSLRSKYWPLGGTTVPSEPPEWPPIAPYAMDDVGGGGVFFKGPCCCALDRYAANESGRASVGEAGWT